MLSQFILAANVVFPLFFMIIIGYCFQYCKLYDEHTLNQLNYLTFTIFLPLHLFQSIYNSDFSTIMNVRVMQFIIISLCFMFVLCLIIIPKIEHQNSKRGVMIQGIIRSNYLIIGFPIMTSLFASDQLGIVALILAVSMPVMNPMAVIALELYRGHKVNYFTLIKNVLKNPFVSSTIAGLLFQILHLRLPVMIETPIKDLAKLGTPLALLLLGAAFKLDGLKQSRKQLCIVLIAKLVILPWLAFQAALFFQFNQIEIMSIVIFYGAPTAVSTYAMAKRMEGDDILAQDIVIYSTLLSMITMVGWITYLNSFFG